MTSLELRSLQRSEVHRHAEMASDSTGSGEHLPSRMLVEKHSRITAESIKYTLKIIIINDSSKTT